ncbi:hypothetical protein [uncultured Sphingomonas sp.]|nr:hypothetical protein [uncultured Sphingomonas sp.]
MSIRMIGTSSTASAKGTVDVFITSTTACIHNRSRDRHDAAAKSLMA